MYFMHEILYTWRGEIHSTLNAKTETVPTWVDAKALGSSRSTKLWRHFSSESLVM